MNWRRDPHRLHLQQVRLCLCVPNKVQRSTKSPPQWALSHKLMRKDRTAYAWGYQDTARADAAALRYCKYQQPFDKLVPQSPSPSLCCWLSTTNGTWSATQNSPRDKPAKAFLSTLAVQFGHLARQQMPCTKLPACSLPTNHQVEGVEEAAHRTSCSSSAYGQCCGSRPKTRRQKGSKRVCTKLHVCM